jgi:hypothetical protein
MAEIIFDKQVHDFGTVPQNSVQQTVFNYIGDEPLVASDFQTTCTCTAGMYNPETKQYIVGLATENKGENSRAVIVKGTYHLILKINVV